MVNNTLDQQPYILIVDDRPENLIAMKKTLSPLNLQIITASSGNEALQRMLSYDFAVVLLDVMMPGMDGFEVASLMHENDATKYMPIIFITAINKSEQYYIKGMEAGAIDYLYKPIDPIILLSKVRVFVDLYTVRNKLEKTISALNGFQTQLQDSNLRLKQLSEEDMLTEVSNRRYFVEECNRLLDENKTTNKRFALFFVDVDDFKSINDTLGHHIGDKVLVILAQRLRDLANDPVMQSTGQTLEIVARLGGDEFAMLLSGNSYDQQAIQAIADQVIKNINQKFNCQGRDVPVTISVGIAFCQPPDEGLTELLRTADSALYESKKLGKNMFSIYKAK